MAAPVVPPEIISVPPEYTPSAVPHDRLAGVSAAHAQLGELVARLDDAAVARPSLLPGWTVGHLLTHLARNADSHSGMVEAAGRGELVDQYPGGDAQRDGDIADGAGRPAELLVADLSAAQRRLEQAWDELHVATWRSGYGFTASLGPVSLADLVLLRWREVEIHAVDLGVTAYGGPSWADLSPSYVGAEWAWSVARLHGRLEPGTSVLLAPGDRTSTVVRSESPARPGTLTRPQMVIPSDAAVRSDVQSPPGGFPPGGRSVGESSDEASSAVVSSRAASSAELSRVEAPTSVILRWLAGRGGEPSWPILSRWT